MAKTVVIEINGRQFSLTEGKSYTLPKFNVETGKTKLDKVLSLTDGDSVEFGKPYLGNVSVDVEVLGHEKGRKVVSRIYKAKSRYRRTRGKREENTQIKVISIK
jgi:large subunit ribosomal protein L21